MKRIKIEDLPIKVIYSDENKENKGLKRVLCDIIKREIKKDESRGDNNEKV
ncbi:hypothetical protein UT300009_30310 [Paraclostridium bifermentans]